MAVKEERRARVQKIMGGGDKKPSPKITAENLLPTKPGGGARITSEQVQSLHIVNIKLGEVSNGLKDQLVLSKVREGIKKRRAEKERRRAREAQLEAKKGKKEDKGGGIKAKGMNFFEKVFNFLLTFLIGSVIMKLVDRLGDPKFQGFLKGLTATLKWLGNTAGTLFNAFVSFIDWAYGLYDKAEQWIGNTFGEEALEKFKIFSKNLSTLINGFIVWKLVFEKIFKSIIKNVTRAFKFVRNVIRSIWTKMRRLMGRKLRMFFKNLAKRAGGIIRSAGRGLLNVGKAGLSRVGGLLSRGGSALAKTGAGKIVAKASGLVVKIFGKAANIIGPAIKGAMPAVKGFFGRIPILGPLIVGIVSLMSGEPPGQALFKTMGAALGGALGTFIPVPILGTLLGEAVGVFVGDLMYHLIIKSDPKAAMKLFGDTMKGIFNAGKAVVNWIFGGGLFNLLKQGAGIALKFGKWIFFEAIPWAAAKIGGIGKIIADWIGAGVERWKSSFPMFEIPNVGIQDALYKFFDMKWPDIWPFSGRISLGIGGEPVLPFLEGWRPDFLENLPRLPRILGFLWQNVPGLSALVDSEGEVKGFPKFWLLANPFFMMSHTKNAFFPGTGGSKSSSNGGAASVAPSSGNSDASDVSESTSYEEGGEGEPTIIPIPIVRAGNITTSSGGGSGGGRRTENREDPMLVLYQG